MNIEFKEFDSLDKNKIQLPDFPVDKLPDDIQRYVREVSEYLQIPVDATAVSVLSKMAICLQGKLEVEVKPGWREPLNLYTAVIMRPSERKTPLEKMTSAPIFEFMKRENEKRQPLINEYEVRKKVLTGKLGVIQDSLSKEGSGRANKKNTYTEEDAVGCLAELENLEEVKPLKLLADDVTPESLAKLMTENNEKMAISSTEGGLFGMLAGRYSEKNNIDLFLKAYNGEYYSSSRISRKGEELYHPLLTLSLMVQPKVAIDSMGNAEFRGRGFLARFLFSMPESLIGSRKYSTTPVAQETMDTYREIVFRLLGMPENNGVIQLSEDAFYASEVFFDQTEFKITEDLEEIEDWAGKLQGNIMRIAGILHVLKHQLDPCFVKVDLETMHSAIVIGQYFVEHSQAVFNITGFSDRSEIKDAKYIMRKLTGAIRDNNADMAISKREAIRLCRRFQKAEDMEPALQLLVEHGYIAIVKERTGKQGKPPENIYINPQYLKCMEERRKWQIKRQWILNNG